MSATGPNVETEVKIRFPAGAGVARQTIEAHGYQLSEPRTLEADQLFEREGDELRRSGRLLRLRRTGDRATITYKGPASGGQYKSREEIEFDVSGPKELVQVLDRLGYSPSFRYEKYRTKFANPNEPGLITVDETPIGVFLELEGEPNWIDRTATRLGFSTI
jgi:adenylate cyclase, class 2